MSHQPQGFWRRPLSRRASRTLQGVLFVGAIFGEMWMGRKRLFVAHDRQYMVAFVIFMTCEVILLGAFNVVAARARRIGDDASFATLRVWIGVLSGLAVGLVGIFGDYTSSKFEFRFVIGSVITGLVLGGWNAASMKKPTIAQPM